MSMTDDLILELRRTLGAMMVYQQDPDVGDKWFNDPNHAAASRASLDCTKALARWRQLLKSSKGVK